MSAARGAWGCARPGVLALTLVAAIVGSGTGRAQGRALEVESGTGTRSTSSNAAPSKAPSKPPGTAPSTAPGGPPLAEGSDGGTSAGEESEAQPLTAPPGESDPLVGNGLGSPLCKGVLRAELPAASRTNCETSGFVAAPAPSGDYGLDVHINTGIPGLSSGWISSAVQDLFITPVWTVLVWSAQALIVMFEWCYTIDLLGSASALGVGTALRDMQATLTQPWLVSVLAIASVLTAYNGLVRRRVAQTLGEALVMLAMMAAGLWIIFDPTGTVGALGRWANQTSLGTLAVASGGAPSGAGRELAESMGVLFAAAIEAPWCYLEFGDVAWCRDPSQLDARLRRAGLKIAAGEQSLVGCGAGAPSGCVPASSPQGRALQHSAQLLRAASSNGALVLALPANGPARNSINDQGSLLRTMCQSSEAEVCRGSDASQAEFRSAKHTTARLVGLLLIVAGVLGMLLLLGFIALRLLAAALFSLLYLLLAPAAVLAPALGEGGRAAFRRWLTKLLGAVVSKLVYSFLLGVVLTVVGILSELRALGWWTQWLLTSAFWWGAYARRHQAFELAHPSGAGERLQAPRSIARRVGNALETPRAALRGVSWAKRQRQRQPPSDERPAGHARADWERRRELALSRVHGLVEHEHEQERADERMDAAAGSDMPHAADSRQRLATLRAQLARIGDARQCAIEAGDGRRAIRLEVRARRVESEIDERQRELTEPRRWVAAGHDASPRAGRLDTDELPRPDSRRPARRTKGASSEPAQRPPTSAPSQRRVPSTGAHEPPGEPPSVPPVLPSTGSSVLDDAREVAAGRKRQLGHGRP